jgi:two-component system, LuxR family, sensor kinase FixL
VPTTEDSDKKTGIKYMARDDKIRELIKNRAQDVSSSCLVTSSQVWLKVKDLMTTDVAVVEPEQSMAMAATVMADDSLSSLVVVDNGTVAGIITEKDFLERVVAKGKSTLDMKVRDVMSYPVVSVLPEATVLEAGQVVKDKHVKRLPVIDRDKKLVGIITQTDLIRVLTSYGMWREVAEIMTKDVATIQRDASVAEAASIMASRGISGIVVMQAEQIVGILTERDLLKRVVAVNRDPACVKVEDVMSSPVERIPPHFAVFTASRIMEKSHVRRLVVEDNGWLCGVVTQTDIFRAVEEKWRQEEEKNLESLEESDACIYTLDLDGRTTYINPAFMRLLEIGDISEVVGKPFLPERFWFDTQERGRFVKELEKGNVHISDLTLKNAGGKRVDVTVYSSFTKNIHGQVDGSQGVVQDITAKKDLVTLKETQKALTASEERYRRITEAVTDYLYTVRFASSRPVETVHSQTSVAVTGYSPEEFKANPALWLNIVHSEDLEVVREQVSRCISGQNCGPIEHRIIRKDGNIRWVRRTLVPTFDSQGKIVSYDGLLQDITELKIAEHVQIQLLGELEQAIEELRDFAYIASHDLKEPFRGRQSTDFGDKLGDEGKEHIKLLIARVKRMYNLIDGVLAYSQVARKEKSVEVGISDVVSEVIADLGVPKSVEMVIEKPLPTVIYGRNSIRQVFYNLIGNAVNFMDKANGRVAINWAEEHNYWEFSVADNGPGIEDEHLDKIFRIFQTLSPRDHLERTGVGLMITKKIVEFYGGKIWIQSKPGKGSTFFFTLPKEHIHAENAMVPATAGAGSQ